MDFLNVLAEWITEPSRWQGPGGVPARVVQHLSYAGGATIIAATVALPAGVALGHRGRYGTLVINIANIGRAIPTFALILLLFALAPFETWVIYLALIALAVPPMLTNAYVGIRQVDPEVRDAAKGMGMSASQMIRRVEIPMAMPLIMSGLRTSAVQVVATTGLAAFASFGGLGRFVIDGFAKGFRGRATGLPEVIWGAALIALLAVATELVLARVQVVATPRGLRRPARATAHVPAAAPAPGLTT